MNNIELPDTKINAGDGVAKVTSCVTLPTNLGAAAWLLAIFGTDRQLCILDASGKMKGLRGSGMLLAAHKLNLNQEAVYFTPNTVVVGVNKKPTSAEITHINAFYIDVDWGWAENKGNFPATHAAVMLKAQGLRALPCPPSVIVSTGGGIQAFWITSEPLEAKEFKARAVELNKTLAGMFGGDAVHSIDHAFRLPGFVNYPKKDKRDAGQLPALVTVIFESDRRYTIRELEKAYLHACDGIAPERKKTAVASPDPFLGASVEAFKADPRWNTSAAGVNEMAAGTGPDLNELISLSGSLIGKLEARDLWFTYINANSHMAAQHAYLYDAIYKICDDTCSQSPNYTTGGQRAKFDELVGYAHARIAAGEPLTGMTTIREMATQLGGNDNPAAVHSATLPPLAVEVMSSTSLNNTPHRQWLYGIELVKGEISVLAAPGGFGKSAHALAMAIAVASGKEFLGVKVYGGPQPVLFLSSEDDMDEVRRRCQALKLQHNLSDTHMANLRVLGAREVQGLWLTSGDENHARIDQRGFQAIAQLLENYAPALLVLDPLGLLCPSGINNNGLMAQVMMKLKQPAIKHRCAVLVVHHTRKGEDKTSVDSIAGASAIVNHARIANTFARMTEKEGEEYGLLPAEIAQHYKIINAKMNLAKKFVGDDVWYEMISVTLGNAEPPIYNYGDNVQAVRRAPLKQMGLSLSAQQLLDYRYILDFAGSTVNRAGTGDPFSLHPKGGGGKSRSLLSHIAQALGHRRTPPLSTRDAAVYAKRCIDDLMDRGWLYSLPSPNNGPQKGWSRAAVEWESTPWAAEVAAAKLARLGDFARKEPEQPSDGPENGKEKLK